MTRGKELWYIPQTDGMKYIGWANYPTCVGLCANSTYIFFMVYSSMYTSGGYNNIFCYNQNGVFQWTYKMAVSPNKISITCDDNYLYIIDCYNYTLSQLNSSDETTRLINLKIPNLYGINNYICTNSEYVFCLGYTMSSWIFTFHLYAIKKSDFTFADIQVMTKVGSLAIYGMTCNENYVYVLKNDGVYNLDINNNYSTKWFVPYNIGGSNGTTIVCDDTAVYATINTTGATNDWRIIKFDGTTGAVLCSIAGYNTNGAGNTICVDDKYVYVTSISGQAFVALDKNTLLPIWNDTKSSVINAVAQNGKKIFLACNSAEYIRCLSK